MTARVFAFAWLDFLSRHTLQAKGSVFRRRWPKGPPMVRSVFAFAAGRVMPELGAVAQRRNAASILDEQAVKLGRADRRKRLSAQADCDVGQRVGVTDDECSRR